MGVNGWLMNPIWDVWMYGDIMKWQLDMMNNGINTKDINRRVTDE